MSGATAPLVANSAAGLRPQLSAASGWAVDARLWIGAPKGFVCGSACETLTTMPIAAADVRPGKCFLSQGAKPQVVRVLSVQGGQVRFEARQRRRAWGARGETAVLEFVAGLLKEVGSDYEPGADGRVHV